MINISNGKPDYLPLTRSYFFMMEYFIPSVAYF
jgi:hypothetical protein